MLLQAQGVFVCEMALRMRRATLAAQCLHHMRIETVNDVAVVVTAPCNALRIDRAAGSKHKYPH
jgi:hypothetical protein